MFKKSISIILVLVLLSAIVVGCSDSKTGEKDNYISIATGGPAGTYFPLGGAIAKIFNDNIEGITANVQSTGASVENIGLISKGEAEVAFVQNDITYYAYTGTESFEGKGEMKNIRGLAMIYPELVQIIVTEESGIESVEDLRGKKVAIGASGSGVEATARRVLAVHDMTYDDLGKADYLSFNEAVDQLKNRQIDAAFITAGVPTSAVTELGQTSKIKIIPIESNKVSELKKDYPFYTEVVIPADTYNGQSSDVTTAAVMAMLVVPEDLDEELAYQMTKELFDKRQTIIDTHSRGNDISLETALEGMPIELHPGAKRYFDEQGVE